MYIEIRSRDSAVEFIITPSAEEQASYKDMKPRLGQPNAHVYLPENVDTSAIHFDLLALSGFLIAGPFAQKELTFNKPISKQMADALMAAKADCVIGPVDASIIPRQRPMHGVPGLCFSGGVDSMAALELLPIDTEMFFVKRVPPPIGLKKPSAKSMDGGSRACAAVAQSGRVVFQVETDLEHVRAPAGFADDMACAVPLILLAQARRIDAVCWGTIAEASYRYGSKKYVDFVTRPPFRNYNPVFTAAGLPFFNPVIGLSEVVTSTIALKSQYKGVIQSCMLGGVEPCGACRKCFRKKLLDAAITGVWPSHAELDALFAEPGIADNLRNLPIKLENIYAFVVSRWQGGHPMMDALKARILVKNPAVEWMERYIPAFIEQSPPDRQGFLKERLSCFVQPMSDKDFEDMLAWDVSGYAKDPVMKQVFRDFCKKLDQHMQPMAQVSA